MVTEQGVHPIRGENRGQECQEVDAAGAPVLTGPALAPDGVADEQGDL